MDANTRNLFDAISKLRTDQIKAALDQGCDLEATNDQGETPLDWIITMYEEEEDQYSVVQMLIRAGADVNRRRGDCHGYAVSAVIQKDLRLLKLLLEHGYDPNLSPIAGETDYDWALTDYIHDYWFNGFPEKPTTNDTINSDRFLCFMERQANSHQVEAPVMLRELRNAGALAYSELEEYGLV